MSANDLIFYSHSEPHACSYLPGELSNSIFPDPRTELSSELLNQLHINGFRRSGRLVYRPQCPQCNACWSARVINKEFSASRGQRRTLKRNQDLQFQWRSVEFSQEHYQLYEKYINGRHQGGDMHPASEEQYKDFLIEGYDTHKFLEMRNEQLELVGVCVVDQFYDGLSAIYSYFDPDQHKRSLGKMFVLALIQLGQQAGLPFTYLGYYVKGSAKMEYKANYQPLEVFRGNQWQRLND